jgi:plasmid stability protein
MANITITLDDDLLKRARIKAAEQGTSVNAVIRERLRDWALADRERQSAKGLASFLRMARESRAGGFRWSRIGLHEERTERWTRP